MTTVGARPSPQPAGFGVGGLAEMPKILVERGRVFAQRERQTGVEIVVGRDAVGDGLGAGFEDVAAHFVDHA